MGDRTVAGLSGLAGRSVGLIRGAAVGLIGPEPDPGPFLQAGGLLSMEAEHYHTNIPRSAHEWQAVTSPAGFSGTAAMRALPEDGTNITTNITTTAPEMLYDVIFAETGTNFVWARTVGFGPGADSATFGLDGAVVFQFPFADSGGTDYVWTFVTDVEIATTGAHTVNFWMREDGSLIDKIVLTTDSEFTPTGFGPAESARA